MKKATSEKKIQSNRENAKRSTGPTSKDGKKKSSTNALKHGAYATSPIILGEDRKLYDAIENDQHERYKPKTSVERALVDQLLSELWNLRRITEAERLFQLRVQEELPKIDPATLTKHERLLMSPPKFDPEVLPQSLRREAVRAGKPLNPSSDSDAEFLAKRQIQIYRSLDKKITRVGEVYVDIFLDSSRERMEKIMSLRRSCLQNILGIERELDKRLRSKEHPAEFE